MASAGAPQVMRIADDESVYLGYNTFNQKERKKKARKLAEICQEVKV